MSFRLHGLVVPIPKRRGEGLLSRAQAFYCSNPPSKIFCSRRSFKRKPAIGNRHVFFLIGEPILRRRPIHALNGHPHDPAFRCYLEKNLAHLVCPSPSARPAIPHLLTLVALRPELEIIRVTLSPGVFYLTKMPVDSGYPRASLPLSCVPADLPGRKTTHLSRRSQRASPLENGTPNASCRVFSATACPTRSDPSPTRGTTSVNSASRDRRWL